MCDLVLYLLLLFVICFTVGTDDNQTDSERSDRRTSKFFNRALPDPPPSDQTSDKTGSQTDDPNNLYELISQSNQKVDVPSEIPTVGETYEDIDNCLERTETAAPNSGSLNDSLSSRQSSASRSSLGRNAVQVDEEYLEPVIPPEEEVRSMTAWRPCPAPRSSVSAAAPAERQTSYVNTEMMSAELQSLADGFLSMAVICQSSLSEFAERATSRYIYLSWPLSCGLEWADFELRDEGQPHLVHQHISYYRATHDAVAPHGCVLMVSC